MGLAILGSTCVVTGGASGIGRTLCEAIAAKGARVSSQDTNAERVHEKTKKHNPLVIAKWPAYHS
jgi:NAD(P)-dependent dehydrogenase (short-subunit alcohol dehydrogenase family)